MDLTGQGGWRDGSASLAGGGEGTDPSGEPEKPGARVPVSELSGTAPSGSIT